ncbi:MAG: hypothetical protein JSU61_10665 [Fidelibacterota bacterium]|nr:MAG: hypothetical protein JSU61_10665 [Candidatus Neomarinimicrobiota bacterium]
MKNTLRKLLFIPLSLALLTPTFAQDLAKTLEALVSENAKSYLGPVVTAFGTGANSGTFQRAKPHKILGFDVTFNVTPIMIPDNALEFDFFIPSDNIPVDIPIPGYGTETVTLPFDVLYSSKTVPTFFGSNEGVDIDVNESATRTTIISSLTTSTGLDATQIESLAGTEIDDAIGDIPPLVSEIKGIDFPMFATIMPQFSVGLPLNLEVTFRGFKTEVEGNTFQLGGFGGKIGFSEFIPLFPVDLAAGWYATNLNLADIVKGSNSIMTLQASKSIPIITVYGGFGIESTNLEVSYDYTNPADQSTDTIEFKMEGKNKSRVIAGLRLKLAVITLNLDVNTGEYTAYNLGVGLTLR